MLGSPALCIYVCRFVGCRLAGSRANLRPRTSEIRDPRHELVQSRVGASWRDAEDLRQRCIPRHHTE